MAESILLALPARLLPLRVTLGASDGMSTLEDLAARAILLGHRTTEALKTFFAVPERLMVDVVMSLWTKGFVTADLNGGQVELTDTARDLLVRNRSLAESGNAPKLYDFVFEPVTGRILDEDDSAVAHRPRPQSLALPLRGDLDLVEVPQAGLVETVQVAFNRKRRHGFDANVLSVRVENQIGAQEPMLRWVHVPVSAAMLDVETARVRVKVDDHVWQRVEPALNTYVADLLDREPESAFVRAIRGRAEKTKLSPESIPVILTRMGATVAELERTPREQAALRQRTLLTWANVVHNKVVELRRAHCEATLVVGAQGHDWTVRDLINGAAEQLVIVAPTLDYEPFADLLEDLRNALRRGVKLVVLWGRGFDEKLPERVRNALNELAERHSDDVRLADRSCRTDACLIIQDNRQALVASHAVTSLLKGQGKDLGVLIGPAADGPPVPEVVARLLAWTRQEFPDWREGRRILAGDDDFSGTPPEWGGPRPMVWPSVGPEQAADLDEDTAAAPPERVLPDEAEIGLWAEAWVNVHRALQDQYGRCSVLTTARLMESGQDREGCMELIRRAERQLLISDDRIDARVANPELASTLRECRRTGTQVRLLHPAFRSQDAEQEFNKLSGGANHVTVRLVNGGPRLVIADGEALLGSFSPLAGHDERLGARYRRRSQLGIRLAGGRIAGEMAAELGGTLGPPPAEPPPEPAPQTAVQALPLLNEARTQPTPAAFGALVASRLVSLADPWQLISEWRSANVPEAELSVAVAAAVRAGLPGAGRDRWTRWLVTDAWRKRSFVEAALLAPLLAEKDAGLRTAAVLTATLDFGPLGRDVLEEPALELADGPAELRLFGAVSGLTEALIWADPEGLQIAGIFCADLPPAWAELTRLVLKYDPATEGALPLEEIVGAQTRRALLADADAVCAGIVAEVDRLELLRNRFNFNTGRALYNDLFGSGGLLSRIREAARRGVPALRDVELPVHVRAHLDDGIKKAGKPPMAWYRQMNYLRSVEEIVDSVRQVVAAHDLGSAGTPRLGAQQRRLAGHLVTGWDRLFAEVAQIEPELQPPPLALLERLRPLSARMGER